VLAVLRGQGLERLDGSLGRKALDEVWVNQDG
jgi:hypothetical protein